MNTPIKTNQLNIQFNATAFNEKYDVFKIETSEKYFKHGAYILDAPLLCNSVRSVFFDFGKSFYVLMNKESANKTKLKEVLLSTEGGDTITISEENAETINYRVVISLLLNALGTYDLDFLRCNNLTGHLYCFHPKWLKKKKDEVVQIPCLELSVNKELMLTILVRTFTSELLRSKMTFTKKRFEEYTAYTLAANNTLRRKLSSDKTKSFILRQISGRKTDIPFLNVQNNEFFEVSKMGVLTRILNLYNEKYNGICHIDFKEIAQYTAVTNKQSLISENKEAIKRLLAQHKIKIIDYVNDGYSDNLCKDIQSIFKVDYGIKVSKGKRISSEHLNLCIIHNADYYKDGDDPYKKSDNRAAVQHITLEDFWGNAKSAISTVVHELLIKDDLKNKRLSLYDWSTTGFTESISFGLRENIEGKDRYFFLKIMPDGTLNFSEKQLDLFEVAEYTDCVNIFADAKDIAGIIQYDNGEINIIRDTSLFTIPEIEEIQKELSNGNTRLRGRVKREQILSAVTDIKMFEQDNGKYYFVGVVGSGMKPNVNDAANIRKIEAYKNAPIRFEELLPLMNVTFVRNGQLTVIPFPFKYLREYISASCLSKI